MVDGLAMAQPRRKPLGFTHGPLSPFFAPSTGDALGSHGRRSAQLAGMDIRHGDFTKTAEEPIGQQKRKRRQNQSRHHINQVVVAKIDA